MMLIGAVEGGLMIDLAEVAHLQLGSSQAYSILQVASAVSGSPKTRERQPLSDEDFNTVLARIQESSAEMVQSVGGLVDVMAGILHRAERVSRQFDQAANFFNSRPGFLASIGLQSLRPRLPIPIQIAEKDGTYTAHAADLEVFGSGESEYEAMEDLRRVIAEEFDFLVENANRLDVIPARQLARFHELIERVER
jgi:hypothetical protein